jgi:histidine triad (HIT) family protein
MSDVLNYDENCLFCNIIKGNIPSTKVYEDNLCFAFRDINPQAPTHILVIPKAHIKSVNDIKSGNSALVAHIFTVIPKIAESEGLTGGYRVVSNCGDDAGQTVPHLHFHILGGERLSDKMS